MMKKAAQSTPNTLLQATRKERSWTQQQFVDRIEDPSHLLISNRENRGDDASIRKDRDPITDLPVVCRLGKLH
jgi:hypothetical protein